MSIVKSQRARGGNRGGCGGGYERTSPDYCDNHLRQLKKDVAALAPEWREVFMNGLSRWERRVVEEYLKGR